MCQGPSPSIDSFRLTDDDLACIEFALSNKLCKILGLLCAPQRLLAQRTVSPTLHFGLKAHHKNSLASTAIRTFSAPLLGKYW